MRTTLPTYETQALAADWAEAKAVFERIGELEVPAAMMVGTRRILYQTVRAMGAVSVLDIGTHTGLSALTFALAGCDVVTLDKVDANGPNGRWLKFGRRKPIDTLRAAGVEDRVTFIAQDSLKYLRGPATFDFICIDGCHRESHVKQELPLAIARLKPNGLIFMDDMQPPGYVPRPGWDRIPGPWNAVQRLLAAGLKVRVVPISQTLEGEQTATAFILAC